MKKSVISEADCRLLFDLSPLPMWVYDRETLKFLAVNGAAIECYGYTEEEFLAMTIKEIRPPADIPLLMATIAAELPDGNRGVWRHRTRDERLLDVEVHSRAIIFAQRPARIILAHDVTQRRQAEDALKEKTREIVATWESMTDAFFTVDTEWRFSYVNSQAAVLLNQSRDTLLGTCLWDSFPEAAASAFEREYRKAVSQNVKVEFEEFYPPLDTWFEVHAYPSPLGLSVYFRDITTRKKTDAQLRFQKALLEAQSETSLDGILIVSEEGKILSYNQQFVRMWEIPEDVVRKRDDMLALQAVSRRLVNPQEFQEKVAYLYREKEERSHEELVLRDGRIFDRYSAPITGEDGSYYGRVWYFRDVTERKLAELELQEANIRLGALAITDDLTGLNNRRALDVGLQRELQRAQRQNQPLSLVFLDLDKFKDYNDSFGHVAGDRVLQAIGRLLREHAREIDLVARYGGEEFAVVLANADDAEAMAMAERLRCSIEAATWENRAITASFGVATVRPNESGLLALLMAADTALYHSKNQGRNRVTHYAEIAADIEL